MNVAMTDRYVPGDGFFVPLWRFLKRHFYPFNLNPTRKWVRNPEIELILDLDNNTFSGIGYGNPHTALSFLGPCDEFVRMDGCIVVDEDGRTIESTSERSYGFDYHSGGFGFGADENWRVDAYHIDLQPDPEQPKSRAYTGRIIWKNRTIDLAALANTESLTRLLGPPETDVENQGGDIGEAGAEFGLPPYIRYLVYTRPNASWMIFVDKAGRTSSFLISRKVSDASSGTGRKEEII